MPIESTLAVLAVAVIAILVLLVFALVPPWFGRRSPLLPNGRWRDRGDIRDRGDFRAASEPGRGRPMMGARGDERSEADWRANARAHEEALADRPVPGRAGAGLEGRDRFEGLDRPRADGPDGPDGLGEPGDPARFVKGADSPAVMASAYDRIVRIVAMVFILAAVTVVTVSGVWPATQDGVVLLLVMGMLVVLIVHDIVPWTVLRSVKFALEGVFAIVLATLLILFTGRQSSPFFLAFPLIVAGGALVASARTTLILAVASSVAYVLALVAGPGGDLGAPTISTISMNVTSLNLLAYVAMVVARMQRKTRDAAIRMSSIDALTGLFNRPYLFNAIEQEIARSARTGRGFCLLMMDLDELKTINDRYGHFIGDRALKSVSDVIRYGVRKIDTAARYGGDEFVCLLPETDPTGGYVLGEKIRQGVAELIVPGTDAHTSMSVGMVSYPDDGRTADELMISADRAMYASKRLGKNRVMGPPAAATGRNDAPV